MIAQYLIDRYIEKRSKPGVKKGELRGRLKNLHSKPNTRNAIAEKKAIQALLA